MYRALHSTVAAIVRMYRMTREEYYTVCHSLILLPSSSLTPTVPRGLNIQSTTSSLLDCAAMDKVIEKHRQARRTGESVKTGMIRYTIRESQET